mmetsp:Transcript_36894/g.33151  ORF Transcript_36894/g.33151 Transcript_36894/m.33151 type:complete len:97 (-) Transcript_36894:744-1034(-)
MMRGTKMLTKQSNKYLYNITVDKIIDRNLNKGKIKKKESNANFCSAIMSIHFLVKAGLPTDIFDTEAFLKKRWAEMVKVESFPKLNLMTSIDGHSK